jgi:hypothetical protein
MNRAIHGIGGILLFGVFAAACGGLPAGNAAGVSKSSSPTVPLSPETASATYTPFQPTGDSAAVVPSGGSATPPADRPSIWVSPSLPATFRAAVSVPEDWDTAAAPEAADIQLRLGVDRLVSTWIFALVAPFPTTADGIFSWDLKKAWSGGDGGFFYGRPLLMDPNTLDVFTALWGFPAPGKTEAVAEDAILDTAWSERPAWAIVPWEDVQPRWKVLEVDGQSPMRKDFVSAAYPLTVPISCLGKADLCDRAAGSFLPAANRDPSKLTTVVLTGVTALVRATAATMESLGILYPAQEVGPLLQEADLTHISNEIPFSTDCPPPDPSPGIYRFCSDPRYIGLLEYIGTDIVELTGNHVLDYGADSLLYTMDLYRQRGWRFYASGENISAAREPIRIEHNGNRLAFIGCNRPGYNGEWATDDSPGAAPCDFDYLLSEIRQLRSEGYLPIMTFQYYEYYHYEPTPQQAEEFGMIADAGAVIVSGSQAHHPQGFAFAGGALIHYGLGNLFFDQYDFQEGTNLGFIDRHVFYAGRYLGVELITIHFVDYARPLFMDAQHRSDFLETVFAASGW